MKKVMIQDNHSLCYLTEADTWEHNSKSARNFGCLYPAAQHCARAHLTDVRIIISNKNPDGRNQPLKIFTVPRVPEPPRPTA